jgi:probable selenium-dependent hydroxylase accessory protein YqeC
MTYALLSLKKALLLDKSGVVSLVGAGGKTSLMFRLARELSLAGDTVLTTTTTKIMKPDRTQSPALILSAVAEKVIEKGRNLVKEHPHITAALSILPGSGEKLVGFAPEVVDRIMQARLFNWILVEADGAAGRPLKAPAQHEPVIPQSSGWVIGLMGIKGVGKPLESKWVFRPRIFGELTGLKPGETVSEASVAIAAAAPQGMFKGSPAKAKQILFLNLAGQPLRLARAHDIAGRLCDYQKQGSLNRIIIGNALDGQAAMEYIDISSMADPSVLKPNLNHL